MLPTSEQVCVTDGHMRIDSTGNNVKILVLKAQRKMTGKYILTAKNEHGDDEAQLEFTVLGELWNYMFYYCKLLLYYELLLIDLTLPTALI